MSIVKEEMLRQQGFKRDQTLAEIVGITYGELEQTEWELKENTNNDGLVVDLLVVFSEFSPKNILAKIEGLDENNTVWLDPHVFSNWNYRDEEV